MKAPKNTKSEPTEKTQEEYNVNEYYPIYGIGDIVMTLNKSRILVITGIRSCYYEFLELHEHGVRTLTGDKLTWPKGTANSQPINIINRHFALYEFDR